MRKAVMNPCGHRVLVLPKIVEETSDGGIIIHTDETSMKMEKAGNDIGTIFRVGPNAWKAYDDGHAWAKEGDTVVYAKWGGVFVTDPDTKIEYILLNDEDIALVVETEVEKVKKRHIPRYCEHGMHLPTEGCLKCGKEGEIS